MSKLEYHDFNTSYELWMTYSFTINGVEITYMNNQIMIANMTLREEKKSLRYVYVSPGYSFTTRSYAYIMANDDIKLYHNIDTFDGVQADATSVCSSVYYCSPFVRFNLWQKRCIPFWNEIWSEMVETGHSSDQINFKTMYSVVDLSCICDKFYGLHWFSVRRKLYDYKTDKYYYDEFDLPFKFVVFPRNGIFFQNNKYKIFNSDAQQQFETSKGCFSGWKYIKDELVDSYTLQSLIEVYFLKVLEILMHVITVVLIYLASQCVNQCLNRRIIKNSKTSKNLQHEILTDKVAICILNAEEDDKYTAEVICPMVKKFACPIGSALDILPGELRLNGIVSSLENACLVVVNITENFLNDRLLKEFILPGIVLTNYSRKIPVTYMY